MARKQQQIKIRLFLAAIAVLALGFASIWLASEVNRRQLSPDNTDAVYGGSPENSYQVMGFMVSFLEDDSFQYCGVAFLGPKKGVTAAHCLESDHKKYVGRGDFTLDLDKLTEIESYQLAPLWDGAQSKDDVAVFTLARPVDLPYYATITEAESSCNYTIVGYGRTENDDPDAPSPYRPRNSISVCVTSGRTLVMTGSPGGVCFGDSGSPVFITNTNQIVGVVSAISTSKTGDDCYVGNIAFSPRLIDFKTFLTQAGSITGTLTPTPTRVDTLPETNEDTSPTTSTRVTTAYIVIFTLISCGLCLCGLGMLLFIKFLFSKSK